MDQAVQLCDQLRTAVNQGAAALKTVLPADKLVALLRATEELLRAEPTLVELPTFAHPEAQVFVFGDTHGHFPDVAYMVGQLGYPSSQRVFVFNGDYVDRGSWGVEVLAFLCAMKCAAPQTVVMLRGNHESSTCTKYYGYYQEVRAKYGKQAKDVYAASKRLFSTMPLAALIANSTLVMHGGLFRQPPEPKRGAKRRKPGHPSRGRGCGPGDLAAGSLDDLRRAGKGGMDPDGCGSSLLATDVLWSDPVAAPGLRENDARGVGLVFGPDVTEAFLAANGLRLVIRSHEGPDARDKRSDLPQVLSGYSYDHVTPAGRLVTVFSAPDYPQFQAPAGEDDEDEEEENAPGAAAASTVQAAPAPVAAGGESHAPPPAAAAEGARATCGKADAATETEATAAAPPPPPKRAPGQRYDNLAAVAVLSGPDYSTPEMRTFAAVRPRPRADPYYDFATCVDSDTEPPAGDASSGGGSEAGISVGGGGGSDAEMGGDEAEGPMRPPLTPLTPPAQQQQQPSAGLAAGGGGETAAAVGCQAGPPVAVAEATEASGSGGGGGAQPMEVTEAAPAEGPAAAAPEAAAASAVAPVPQPAPALDPPFSCSPGTSGSGGGGADVSLAAAEAAPMDAGGAGSDGGAVAPTAATAAAPCPASPAEAAAAAAAATDPLRNGGGSCNGGGGDEDLDVRDSAAAAVSEEAVAAAGGDGPAALCAVSADTEMTEAGPAEA